MGSLKNCLTINDCPAPVAKQIRDIQKNYLDDGYSGADATAKAVEDVLKQVTTQRKDIINQVNKQLKKDHPELVPKEEHPVITKVRKETGEDTLQQVDDDSDQGKAVVEMGKKFKKKIVFFKGSNKANGFFRGDTPDTLFINADSPNMMLFTFGHELTHALKNDNVDLYVELFKQLYGHVGNFDTYMAKQNDNRVKQGMSKLSAVQMAEEFFADFSGEQFTDPKFWNKLLETDKTLFDKVVELFQKIFAQFSDVTGEHFVAINKAQEALAGVLEEYAKNPETAVERIQETIDAERVPATKEFPEIKKDVTHLSLKTFQDERDGYYKDLAENLVEQGYKKERVQKFMDDITSVSAMVFENRSVLDYDNLGEGLYDAIKSNSDAQYFKSEDYTTICRKTLKIVATISAIMKKNNQSLTAENMAEIRQQLRGENEVVNCGICYVFSRWVQIGKSLDQMAHKDVFVEAEMARSKKGTTKEEAGELWEDIFGDVPPELIYDMTLKHRLGREHPKAAKWLRQRGAGLGKAVETRTAYIPGLLEKLFNKNTVKVQNLFSGMRMQSWSDFDPIHMLDMMQVAAERTKIGLAAHAYTKVPDFVRMMAPTGVMINMSLIPEGNGFNDDGSLRFDPVEGMSWHTARRLRKTYETAGTIAIGISDEHIRALLAHPEIDFVIPYHSSGLPKKLQDKLGDNWSDYEKTQNDTITDPVKADARLKRMTKLLGSKGRSEHIMSHEWWVKTDTPEQNTENFFNYAEKNGTTPRFLEFRNEPNAWKLMTDRKMLTNDGQYLEQKPTTLDFNMKQVNAILRKFVASPAEETTVGLSTPNKKIVDRWTNKHYQEEKPEAPIIPMYETQFSTKMLKGQVGSNSTQVATTASMYGKAVKMLKGKFPAARTVLDYGAGLGKGTDAMRDAAPTMHIESFEPLPERWSGNRPVTYSKVEDIDKTYDLVVNTNVLNVLEPELRGMVLSDIANKLSENGAALVTARGWKGDVNNAKYSRPATEDKAIWITKRVNGETVEVYQKGFDADELLDYARQTVGDSFTVSKISGYGKTAVIIENKPSDVKYSLQPSMNGIESVTKEKTNATKQIPSGAQQANDGSSLQDAANVARGVYQAVSPEESGLETTLLPTDLSEEQQEKLNDLRKAEFDALIEKNELLPPFGFISQWKRQGEAGGAEHKIIFSADGKTVRKATPANLNFSVTDYLNRIQLHNYLFPDAAYTLRGVMKIDGEPHLVVDQPAIPETQNITQDEIVEDLKRLGFERQVRPQHENKITELTEMGTMYVNKAQGIIVWDVDSRNVVKTDKGLVYIDPMIEQVRDTETKYSVSPLGFYSGLAKEVSDTIFDQKEMTGRDLLLKLQRAMKRKADTVKKDEIQAIDLLGYLSLKRNDVITKNEVVEYINNNGVKVEEVSKDMLGFDEDNPTLPPFDELEVQQADEFSTDSAFEYAVVNQGGSFIGLGNTEDQAIIDAYSGHPEYWEDSTKYQDYTLPGGENYREVLLTLPGQNAFRSSHWEEPNVLAHIRLNDRNVNGEKVLFVEEIQSDWSLEGRKQGFKGDFTVTEVTAASYIKEYDEQGWIKTAAKRDNINLKDSDPVYLVKDGSGELRYSGWDKAKAESFAEESDKGILPAPFVQDSNWQNLALKRVMRIAAEEGYDRVAWVNGTQTADRYSLDNKLDELVYNEEDGLYKISGMQDGTEVVAKEGVTKDELENVVGKEIAQRIIDGKGADKNIPFSMDKNIKSLKGNDLKIEAKWARNLYDRALPSWMNKFGKKYNSKIEPINIDIGVDERLHGKKIRSINSRESDAKAEIKKISDQFEQLKEEADSYTPQRLQGWKNKFQARMDFQNKLLDNLKAERADLGNTVQDSIPVTEQMRDEVMVGQTLFSLTPADKVRKRIFVGETKEDTVIGKVSAAMSLVFDSDRRGDLKQFFDKARTNLIDKYNPIDKELGKDIYKLHRLLGNSAASISTFLQHGMLTWEGNALMVKTKNEGFAEWIRKDVGDNTDRFLSWVAAKRAELLDAEDRENWFLEADRQVIFKEVEDMKLSKQFEEWNTKLQAYNKNVIDVAIGAGLISKEASESWMSHYYLPFYRMLENPETAEEFLSAPTSSRKHIRSGIKTLKGGEAAIGDPLENLVQNWTHLIAESQRQMARQSAAEMMITLGMGEEMSAGQLISVLGTTSVFGVRKGAGNVNYRDYEGMSKAEVLENIKGVEGAQLIEKQMLRTVNKNENLVMSFMRDGKSVYVKVADPDLFEALTQASAKQLDGALVTGASWFKRMLTHGATFGVGFRIANLLRDTIHTSVVSKSFIPVIDTFKGMGQVIRKSEDYIAVMAAGGGFSQGYLNSADPKALSKSMKRVAGQIDRGAGKGTIVLDQVKTALDFWEKVGHVSEMAARVQLFTNLKKEGKSHMEAAYEARDILDFASSGKSELVRTLIAITPFTNARMQGLDRMARGVIDHPVAFAVKGAIVASASLGLWALYADDDRYKELEDWQKWQYHNFWIGDQHYAIPKAFEVGAVFSTMFEAGADVTTGNEELEYFKNMMIHTITSTFAVSPPTAVMPAIEIWSNKSLFTKRQLESDWMEKLDPGLRANTWDSETLKALGKKFNVSPITMKTILRGYTATIGTGLLTVADFMYEYRDNVVTPQKTFTEYTGLNRFMKTRVSNTKYATRYHEFAQEVNMLANSISATTKMGDVDYAMNKMTQNPDYKARKNFINSVNRQLANIRRQEKLTYLNKTLSRVYKRKQLDELTKQKNMIYKGAYQSVKGFKKK